MAKASRTAKDKVRKGDKTIRVEFELPKGTIPTILRHIQCKEMTGNWLPELDLDPCDWLVKEVLRQIALKALIKER